MRTREDLEAIATAVSMATDAAKVRDLIREVPDGMEVWIMVKAGPDVGPRQEKATKALIQLDSATVGILAKTLDDATTTLVELLHTLTRSP